MSIHHHTETLASIIKVMSVQLFALFISLTSFELWVKIVAGLIAGGYAAWKWYRDYKIAKKQDALEEKSFNDAVAKAVEEELKSKHYAN